MSYQFQRQAVSSFKFEGNAGRSITLSGINGQQTDANIIVSGIQGLLWLGNQVSYYSATDATRTVKESVVEQS